METLLSLTSYPYVGVISGKLCGRDFWEVYVGGIFDAVSIRSSSILGHLLLERYSVQNITDTFIPWSKGLRVSLPKEITNELGVRSSLGASKFQLFATSKLRLENRHTLSLNIILTTLHLQGIFHSPTRTHIIHC